MFIIVFSENKPCNETVTIRKYKHNLGYDNDSRIPGLKPCEHKPTPLNRDLVKINDWQMAPNRYTIGNNYYDGRKGSSGAYWRKKPTSQRRPIPMKNKPTPKNVSKYQPNVNLKETLSIG